MNAPHEAHLQRIKDTFTALVDSKYRAGQAEHGGNLWLKPGMLEQAIQEVTDLAVYLLTLKEQLAGATEVRPGVFVAADSTSVFKGYDVHQAEATLYQCSNCAKEWYRTKAGALDPTVCFECQNAEGR